ncbi:MULTISPECIES: glutathione peroxidase [unclassified Synechocystis]|uniref:glutathione peroxidase n=1 Tax=unclassified Synechocystis TaxID=2640012 RepID=UPI00042300A2|nr:MULTISPECIES: glutathione peroxidase [unclassified Synechocystis]AIE73747.1 Glutathione peroxidase family protein [Synechocystis sp. PCC 6714]MCT0252424.1 glutathione peroxidase [Synechocystis sp. CS-94]
MTAQANNTIYGFSANALDGSPVALRNFEGKVLLVVNTASQCGFTPQYQGLQALQDRFGDRGFTVLGFPCNQFGQQEPGGPGEIRSFCETRYGVTFPLFAKVEVNGPNAHPLFRFLTEASPGMAIPFLGSATDIKWNFTKFLVDCQGKVVKRYGSMTKPDEIAADIEKLL